MKGIVFAIAALVLVSQFVRAAGDDEKGGGVEKTLLIKCVDRSGNVTFELMSPADFKLYQEQIAKEGKSVGKAMMAAEKAWKEDETTRKKGFPRGAIGARTAVSLREFTDATKAGEALSSEEEKVENKAQAEKDRAEKREAESIKNKTRTKEYFDKEKSRDAEKESLWNSARNLFETKLQEVMGQAEGGGGGEGASNEEKRDAKKK